MRKLSALLVSFLCFGVSLIAQTQDDRVKLPDFAYPQDVIKTAEDLIKSGSGDERILGALELWKAKRLIDWQSIPESMKFIESLADKQDDPATKALLKLMAAELGKDITYNRSQVNKYMNGEGTLDEQRAVLDSVVTSLLKDALAIAPPTPLTEFRDALDWNELGLSILPTVRDFVAWYAVHVDTDLIDECLDTVSLDSPIYYALQRLFKMPANDKDKFILDMLNNQAAAYALYLYISALPGRTNLIDSQITSELDFLNKAKEKVAGTWVEETVDNRLKLIFSPYFKIDYEDAVTSSQATPVRIKGYNIDTLAINVYTFRTMDEAYKAQYKREMLTDSHRVYNKILKFNNTVKGETVTDSITLPSGYYVLTAGEGKAFFANTVRSCPWLFVILKTQEKRWLQILDIHTGSPIKGAEAFMSENSNTVPMGLKTDAKGCIELPVKKNSYTIGFRDMATGNIINYPRSIYPEGHKVVDEDVDATHYYITTDRPIYRPGETVRMLMTAYNKDNTIEMSEKVLYIYLPISQTNTTDDSKSDPLELKFGATDKYGRSTAEFIVPEDCPLGDAIVSISSNDRYNAISRIKIAEFKLNDLKITGVTTELMADSIIVRGLTANEAGIGIGNVAINVKVNYQIYPRPTKDMAFDTTTTSDAKGNFIFTVPRYYLGNLKLWIDEKDDESRYNTKYSNFSARINVEAMSPNGRSASTYKGVNMTYPNSIGIKLTELLNRADGLDFDVKIEGYNPPDEFTWSIIKNDDEDVDEELLSGTAKVGIVSLTPAMIKNLPVGKYKLKVSLRDGSAADDEEDFTLYDPAEKYVPTDDPFLIINSNHTGDRKLIRIGIKDDKTNIWVYYRKSGDKESVGLNDLMLYKFNRGWHEIPVSLNHYDKETTVEVMIYAADGDRGIDEETVNFTVNPKDSLSLSCESFRDNLTPGTQETWQFVTRRDNRPTKAAVFVNLMNSKLTPYLLYNSPTPYFIRTSNSISNYTTEIQQYISYWRNHTQGIWDYRLDAVVPVIQLPYWRYLFRSGYDSDELVSEEDELTTLRNSLPDDYIVVGYGVQKKANLTGSVSEMAANRYETESVKNRDIGSMKKSPQIYGYRSPEALTSVELREPKVYTALWEPMLTTGEDGRVDVSFIVPGETTGWVLFAKAWTTDLLSASLTHSFTATKPVVVAPNPPRFVRVGDTVNLVAAVTNTTDSVMNVSVQVAVEADSVSLADALTDMTLAAGETRFVNTPVSVNVTGGNLEYTVRASNGVTGDGERNAVPVLASSALVTESRNFYLNPDQADFSVSLPAPEGSDFESELHFTSNPMWSVVEALPSAIEPWCKAASALAMSVYTSRTALQLNKAFPAAKDVIDIKGAEKTARESLDDLEKLQTADGGFKWGEWADSPDRYSTLAVLDWLASEKDDSKVAALTGHALEYVDKTSVGKDGKVLPDFNYTVIRSFYGMPTDQNGSRVVNATIKDMLSNWKKYSIDRKALAVIALKNYGYERVAKTILGSLRQFGRMTDDRGFEFPNMPTLLAYTHTLEAFASADPKSDIAQRIVQHLLYIRQGMNWGSSAFTTYAVRSIMTAASNWVTKASPVNVTVDGQAVDTRAQGMSGVLNTPVEGRELTISRTEPSTPAYGAVVSRYVAPLCDIAPFSDGEVSISKAIVRIKPDGSQEVLGQNATVTPGERLTIILKVTAKRPLSNLVVTDNRPAAFEPVVQVPRMVWNRTGSPFYLENRDAVTNIYIGYMPAGAAEYTYEVTVNNTGSFTTGLATVTSAIAPEITAHSGSTPLTLQNDKVKK